MKVDELTIGEARRLATMFGNSNGSGHNPYQIGSKMLIRTVTMIFVGRIVEVGPQEIVIEDAAWIADTGRYHLAIRDGALSEVEPYPNGRVIVGRGAVVDACVWAHSLPRDAK